MMKISILMDEISADPETAVELGVQWGVRDFELRGYYTDRAPYISDYQKLRLLQVLDRYHARVIAISPGLFKIPFPTKQPAEFPMPWLDRVYYDDWFSACKKLNEHSNELLPATLDMANEVGAKLVVCFGFSRGGCPPGSPPDELFEILLAAAKRAQSAGVQLVIENEAGFWADTGERTAKIIKTVNHPCLNANWDPCNALAEGDNPYPDGYEHLRGLIQHVHFKDAYMNSHGEPEYVLEGDINWKGQIEALKLDGYSGYICVETHLRPKVAAAKAALERLQRIIGGGGKDL